MEFWCSRLNGSLLVRLPTSLRCSYKSRHIFSSLIPFSHFYLNLVLAREHLILGGSFEKHGGVNDIAGRDGHYGPGGSGKRANNQLDPMTECVAGSTSDAMSTFAISGNNVSYSLRVHEVMSEGFL